MYWSKVKMLIHVVASFFPHKDSLFFKFNAWVDRNCLRQMETEYKSSRLIRWIIKKMYRRWFCQSFMVLRWKDWPSETRMFELTSITIRSLELCLRTLGCWTLTATVFPSSNTALWTCAKDAAPWGFSSNKTNISESCRKRDDKQDRTWDLIRWF